MSKFKMSEDMKSGLALILTLLGLPLVLLLINNMIGGDTPATTQNEREKTVIVMESKPSATPPKLPSAADIKTVRDAINQGNYSTAYMEITKYPSNSPEYEALRKELAADQQRQKKTGVRKERPKTEGAPIRYLDETTPRNREADAVYIYFVETSGSYWPRFCVQNVARSGLGMMHIVITAGGKKYDIAAPGAKFETNAKGVAEWYDAPLDRSAYAAVQALMKTKKGSVTIRGGNGSATRSISDNEIRGFGRIIEGYTTLGGSLSFLEEPPPDPARGKKKRK